MQTGAVKIIVAFIIIAICVFVGFSLLSRRTVGDVLRSYQFTELNPPSTLVPPGTFVLVQKRQPLVLGVICPSEQSFGAELSKRLLKSDSVTANISSALKGSFNIDANQLSLAKAVANGEHVKEISISLSNVKVIEIPDSAVTELIASRDKNCSSAIKMRRDRDGDVTLIKAVLQADAAYKVSFDGQLSASLQDQITNDVAASMGFNDKIASGDSFVGKALYWGIRDDQALADYSPLTATMTGTDNPKPIIPTNDSAKVENLVKSMVQQGHPIGVSLSHFNKVVDWPALKSSGVAYVFVKATEGSHYINPTFSKDWQSAKQAGIARGAYHFFRAESSADEQINNLLGAVKLEPGDLPFVVDYEPQISDKKNADRLLEVLHGIASRTGVVPLIYASFTSYERLMNDARFKDYKFWVAIYSDKLPSKIGSNCLFWQFSGNWVPKGLQGSVDANQFRGSFSEFDAIRVNQQN